MIPWHSTSASQVPAAAVHSSVFMIIGAAALASPCAGIVQQQPSGAVAGGGVVAGADFFPPQAINATVAMTSKLFIVDKSNTQ